MRLILYIEVMESKEHCGCCDKALKPAYIIQGEKLYHECDACIEVVCTDCIADTDENTGRTICVDCYQSQAIRESQVS